MISLSHLNRSILFTLIFITLTFQSAVSENEPADIWEKQDDQKSDNIETDDKDFETQNSTISEDVNRTVIKIDEDTIEDQSKSVIGIFDPEKNNFNLNMWFSSDGDDIKKILTRLNKIKLSEFSEDLLFQVLFTNSYAPNINLDFDEFLKIKIDWLNSKKRIKDLEQLLNKNPEVGKNSKAIKFLVNEYLASADIKSACEKISYIDSSVKNNYLEKFIIYCLINNNREDEAQLIFDLLMEKDEKDKFFQDKINFLLKLTEKTSQKILDNNLLNFYLSHITIDNFKYEPHDKTKKYIWRYLSAANLIEINNFEDENIITKYEQAAAENSFDKNEIFKIYLQMNFNFTQLSNSQEIYKSLPNSKARALIYQSIMLSDNIEKKIKLSFLLKDLFRKDKIFTVYADELSAILKSFDKDKIPENYVELVNENLEKEFTNKIKFNNEILHRSKVIRHFLENDVKKSRTEKDLKAVHKKIKKNKKYFISIKDIVVLESLAADGISLPDALNQSTLSSELTVPKSLYDLVSQNQIGLVMLKIIEIIGEDDITNLDPETIYFLVKILNELDLKKIRNNILTETLPVRVQLVL